MVAFGAISWGGLAPQPAAASPHDRNAGDVWLDNVGQPPGPGHEHDPHLACADINLWGNNLADSSGSFTIDGWPPSGSKKQAYSSAWTYNTTAGGDQTITVDTNDPGDSDNDGSTPGTRGDIEVSILIANAIANGDSPVNKQGFHFKLQFVQDPQKHKTFWVNCLTTTRTSTPTPTPTTPSPTPTPTATPTPTTTPTPGIGGNGSQTPTPGGGIGGNATSSPGGVLGISTTSPNTGADIPLGLGTLLALGGVGVLATRRKKKSERF